MRILTVRQPWAWAIIHGGKDVENRSSNIAGSYRGPVAIHVSRSLADASAWTDPNVEAEWSGAESIPAWSTTLGAVIGVVDLVDVHNGLNSERSRMRAVRSCFQAGMPYGPCSPWAMADHHHLVLANPRPLPQPIPATGRLGLWRPDDALLAAITEQLQPSAAAD